MYNIMLPRKYQLLIFRNLSKKCKLSYLRKYLHLKFNNARLMGHIDFPL